MADLYTAAVFSAPIPALATDVFTISGSATKQIQILSIIIDGVQTAAGNVICRVLKRSTLDTGGTFTTPLAVPLNSLSPAATAIIKSYSVLPTPLGTLVGDLKVRRLFLPIAVSAVAATPIRFPLQQERLEPVAILSGLNEMVAVHFNSVTIAGGLINYEVSWVEV